MHVHVKLTTLLRTCHHRSAVSALRWLSTAAVVNKKRHYEVVVVGGGSGGCSVAAKLSSQLGKGKVAVIEPTETHYYQPLFTLVGGGMKTLEQAGRPMKEVLPADADWLHTRVLQFDPDNNNITTEAGETVDYNYLVVALGLQLDYHKIPGLVAALDTPGVCSIYSPQHVNKTMQALKNFKSGNAIFTMPATPIKCPGAPQKIMYIAEEYLRKHGRGMDSIFIYNTSMPVLFSVKEYAESLWKVVSPRGIKVRLRQNLVEVLPGTREAVFQDLDRPHIRISTPYELLHVVPPMSTPDVLRNNSKLVDDNGFLSVSKYTLQHTTYSNVFGLGDCTNTPNAKTAAAVAGQNGVLTRNLTSVMNGQPLTAKYDGYSSCPLVTGYSKCVMAEFDYSFTPLETFPFNQTKERRSMFHVKKTLLPALYWEAMLKGRWEGPSTVRKIMHLGMK